MKTTLAFAMALAGILAAGCASGPGSTSGNTTGALTTAEYYNLTPGICGEFSNDAGGAEVGPTIGLFVKTSASPPGLELRRVRHGQKEESDYVSFDGGLVYLTERAITTSVSNTQEVYVTPLEYLPAPPLAVNGQSLDSNSACAAGSPCITIHLDTSVAMSRPYTGPYAVPDGGMTEYKLNFTYTDNNDGGSSIVEAWITPGIGFTDLFLPSDTGGYTDYLLVDIVSDGGPCANH